MIYRAIRSLCEKKSPIDMVTLDDEVTRLYPKASGEDTAAIIKAVSNGILYPNLDRYP